MDDINHNADHNDFDGKTLLFCWVRTRHASLRMLSTTRLRRGPCRSSCCKLAATKHPVCVHAGSKHPFARLCTGSCQRLLQEHKNIPYIVAELGLVKEGEVLTWGLDPKSGVRRPPAPAPCHHAPTCDSTTDVTQADDNTNFTAVWVFTPSEKKFEVFQEFEVVPDSNSSDGGFTVQPPQAGYQSVLWETQFEPDTWIRKDDPRHKDLVKK